MDYMMIIEPQILVSLIRMYYICNQKTKSPLLLMLRIKDGLPANVRSS